MPPLDPQLRRRLETTVVAARGEAEAGARAALQSVAVHHHEPYTHMKPAERAQRNHLRARARQLGDKQNVRGELTIDHLAHECAYEHWHRMLFARFLAENSLLIDPQSKVAVTLQECEELAEEEGVNTWTLAGRFAQSMLPQIFRPDDPLLAITLPTERRVALEGLLADLPSPVFTADDSLGWVYQFWQTAEKERVNASGEKITSDTISAVTQLFTEHYMVLFLLHNTIGAWYAGKVVSARAAEVSKCSSEADVRRLVVLPGYEFEYLRFVKDDGLGWRPAAGVFDGWPKEAKSLKVLDPCCGSGHFLVAALDVLVRLRMHQERLSITDAIAAVVVDNLFGLEIDLRCTQIAAFNVAIAAWKMAGKVIALPELHIACSGIGPSATLEQWLKLAGPGTRAWDSLPIPGREPVKNGLTNLHRLFSQAPELGSLCNPDELPSDLISADWETLQPFLLQVFAAETTDANVQAQAVAAQGMAKAADVLTGEYTLIITNVPYLSRGKQGTAVREWSNTHHADAKADLSTTFVSRAMAWLKGSGTIAVVTPQNWLFLPSYAKFRKRLLHHDSWHVVARLGPNAFRDMNFWAATTALTVITDRRPTAVETFALIDTAARKEQDSKAAMLRGELECELTLVSQQHQLNNPDARIGSEHESGTDLLSQHALSPQGIKTGDDFRYRRQAWEVNPSSSGWRPFQGASSHTDWVAGIDSVIDWRNEGEEFARLQGMAGWGQRGVVLKLMGEVQTSLHVGVAFDSNVTIIVPRSADLLPAIWTYCTSAEYAQSLKAAEQAAKINNGTAVKVPFDLSRWQSAASVKYPNGLPEPQSDDPTQWLFHGHPSAVTDSAVLQVATVRLAGYRWATECDPSIRLAAEARSLAESCRTLDHFADDDGVVPLVPMRGEIAAESRLRELLRASFEGEWSSAKEVSLLAAVAQAYGDTTPASNLDEWLKHRFFDEHCALFGNRPFVWHIWDGRKKDGFGVLVHYHRLVAPDGAGRQLLEKIAHGYLGDWINRQRDEAKASKEGAEARVAAALDLQKKLEAILRGEPPYDIFVRWKPLHEQPIGWEPDINDGVRINIRPFIEAGVLRTRVNVNWKKDRGKETDSLRPREDFPWFWGWDEHSNDFAGGTTFTGDRFNDLHYTNAFKQAARERKAEEVAT